MEINNRCAADRQTRALVRSRYRLRIPLVVPSKTPRSVVPTRDPCSARFQQRIRGWGRRIAHCQRRTQPLNQYQLLPTNHGPKHSANLQSDRATLAQSESRSDVRPSQNPTSQPTNDEADYRAIAELDLHPMRESDATSSAQYIYSSTQKRTPSPSMSTSSPSEHLTALGCSSDNDCVRN